MSPEAVDLGVPQSASQRPHPARLHPSLSPHPPSGPVSGPGTTHRGPPGPRRAPRAGQPSRPRWGSRGGVGLGAARGPGGDTELRAGPAAPNPGLPASWPRVSSLSPPHLPPVPGMSPNLGAAAKAETFLHITCPGARCKERDPPSLTRPRHRHQGHGREFT